MISKYDYYAWTMVRKLVSSVSYLKSREDELQSIALYTVLACIRNYSPSRGSFYVYWERSALRNMNKQIQKYQTGFSIVSLDSYMFENRPLHDVVTKDDKEEEINMLNETFIRIIDDPYTKLTKTEKQIMKLYLSGYDFKEIALELNCCLSGVYKNYNKAVNKIGIVMKGSKK